MWYYIQSIKGIRRDDYHYNHVNKLLNIGFKTYIKMVRVFATVLFECGVEAYIFYSAHSSLVQVACYPEQVRLSNFDTMVNYGLVSSEKVGLLVANLSISQFTSCFLIPTGPRQPLDTRGSAASRTAVRVQGNYESHEVETTSSLQIVLCVL